MMRAQGAACLIAPRLPSVEPLSTTTASQGTEGGLLRNDSKQSTTSWRAFQLTMTTAMSATDATPTLLAGEAAAGPGSVPVVIKIPSAHSECERPTSTVDTVRASNNRSSDIDQREMYARS